MSYRDDNRVALENDHPRIEMVEKVTGKARFTTDHYLPEMLWAAYIRCDYGDARITRRHVDRARDVEGVLEVEIDRERGRYHGDRLGHICAESRKALEEAMAALDLRFDVERPKTRIERERTPLDQLDAPDNIEDAEAALEDSDVTVEAEYQTQVQTHCCMEPHGALVDYKGDSARAWGSTQSTFGFRDGLARELDLPSSDVDFNCEHVGGGFGSKFGPGAEGTLAARMSKKFEKPCRVVRNRKEEQLDTGNRPGSLQYMRLGISRQGRIRGGRIATWGSVGPGGGGGGVRNPSRYDFGTIARSHEDVNLNGGPPRAMRAPGHPQALFAIELMMDRMAGEIGMDPLEFRRVNETSDVRKEMFDAGAAMIGWDKRRDGGVDLDNGALRRGYGVGVGDWGNSRGRASVTVNVYRDGTVEALNGAQDIGTGFRTMLGDVVATHIGIGRDQLKVRIGRSEYPFGPASGGSVTSRFVAPRAFMAADKAKKAILDLVAIEWELDDTEGLSIEDGVIRGPDDRQMEWGRACRLLSEERVSFSADDEGEFWKQPTGSDAVQFVEADVDIETGIVYVRRIVALQDVGLPVNRHTVENQITGAVIQGLSFCLFEDRILNRQTGAMVNPNMDMYKIAGPRDVPEITPVIWRSRDDPGVNSLGEPPIVPTCGAIACAVANAIGTQVQSMPLTPRQVLAVIAGKERA